MNRAERFLLGIKSTLSQDEIFKGTPKIGSIAEGKTILALTQEGIKLFLRHNNKLYSMRFYKESPIEDTVTSITDSSGGTTTDGGTISAISGSGADAGINNNFAELSNKVNLIVSKLSEILTRK